MAIRFALGFPDVYRQQSPSLEGAMDVVQDRPDTVALIVGILANIDTVQSSILSSLSSAGLKRAEDIEWFGDSTTGSAVINQQNDIGRRYCGQLSIVLGVDILNDIFGKYGYTSGEGWKGQANQYGGQIPLG